MPQNFLSRQYIELPMRGGGTETAGDDNQKPTQSGGGTAG